MKKNCKNKSNIPLTELQGLSFRIRQNFRTILLILFFSLSAIFTITCSKNENQETPSFSNHKLKKGDEGKIVQIGKIINGLPEIDMGIKDKLVEGIYNDPYTYRRLFPSNTNFSFDENSLTFETNEQYSGIYYLIIRGNASYSNANQSFIIAYQLIFDQNGTLYNISDVQHVCEGVNCPECTFKYQNNNIIGCLTCTSNSVGLCDHSTFVIDGNGYITIPIEIK